MMIVVVQFKGAFVQTGWKTVTIIVVHFKGAWIQKIMIIVVHFKGAWIQTGWKRTMNTVVYFKGALIQNGWTSITIIVVHFKGAWIALLHWPRAFYAIQHKIEIMIKTWNTRSVRCSGQKKANIYKCAKATKKFHTWVAIGCELLCSYKAK